MYYVFGFFIKTEYAERRGPGVNGFLAAHVVYVPIDFNTQSLAERLLDSGYDPQGKTLFIWQGVTTYLNREAVDSTLDFVVQHSGKCHCV